MGTSVSAADAVALFIFADRAAEFDRRLAAEATILEAAIQKCAADCTEYGAVVSPALAQELRELVQRATALGEWVRTVGLEFLVADTNASGVGLEPLIAGLLARLLPGWADRQVGDYPHLSPSILGWPLGPSSLFPIPPSEGIWWWQLATVPRSWPRC